MLPISQDKFELIEHKDTPVQNQTKGSSFYCCSHKYSTLNSYNTHLKSSKHLKCSDIVKVSTNQENTRINWIQRLSECQTHEELSSTILEKRMAMVPLEVTDCLFCCIKSSDLQSNWVHMSLQHGFFIHDFDLLSDQEGYFNLLQERIAIDNLCLWCDGHGNIVDYRENLLILFIGLC